MEQLIIGGLVAVAASYMVIKIYRSWKGRDDCCGSKGEKSCGGCTGCGHKE